MRTAHGPGLRLIGVLLELSGLLDKADADETALQEADAASAWNGSFSRSFKPSKPTITKVYSVVALGGIKDSSTKNQRQWYRFFKNTGIIWLL